MNSSHITSPWGRRKLFGSHEFHPGTDLGIPTGTPVHAYAGGKVFYVKYDSNDKSGKTGYGLYLVIDHGNGYYSLYGHLSKALVKNSEKIKNGQEIALSGFSGRSTGPHLHLGLYSEGKERFSTFGKTLNVVNIGDLQQFIDNGYQIEEYLHHGKSTYIAEVTITGKAKNQPESVDADQVTTDEQNNVPQDEFQNGRLHPGDYGYMGSYWQAYDDAKNFGNSESTNSNKQ